MTENNKQFILNNDLSNLQDCKCVIDNYADVDTYYTLGATVDLLNELAEENSKLKEGIYPVDIDIISMALVTSFAENYVTLVKLDQELERMGFSETNMQRIKIRNKMKRQFESMLFEFIHWSRIKGVF